MAIQEKSRLQAAIDNIITCGVLAVILIVVLAIIGIWYKPIWGTNTAKYILIYILAITIPYYGILGILANFGGRIGRLCFGFCLLLSSILLIFGIINIFIEGTIYLAIVASNSFILMAGLAKIHGDGSKFDDFAVYLLVPVVLHLIVVPVIAGTAITNSLAAAVCGLEVLYALYKLFGKRVGRRRLFSEKASEYVEVDEETEDEANLKKAIRAQNRQTRAEIRKIRHEEIKKAFASSSGRSRGGRSSRYDDYDSTDWCNEFRRKLENIYTYVTIDDLTSGANLIRITVEINDTRGDSHAEQSLINSIKYDYNKLDRKCPYETSLSIKYR